MNTSAKPDQTDRLRAEIERTREQLGETVQALTHKADVPARAREKLHETKDVAQEKARQAAAKLPEPVRERGQQVVVSARRRPVPIAAAILALLVLIGVLRRRLR